MWHHLPEAQAIIAAINPAELTITRPVAIVGESAWRWSLDNDAARALDKLHIAAVEKIMGCTLAESHGRGCAIQWMEAYNDLPDASDVLNARFGDPQMFAAAYRMSGHLLPSAKHRLNQIWHAECARAAAVREAA